MPYYDKEIRAAIEARARAGRPVGQVEDRRGPLRPTDDSGVGAGRATRFVLVEDPEDEE